MNYLLKDGDIDIRNMEDDMRDYSVITKWLSTEKLLNYYEGRSNSYNLEKVIKKFAPRVKGEEAVTPSIIEYKQKPIGFIQYYPIEPNGYDVGDAINMRNYISPYGIDLFIGETDYWNKGIGTIVVKSLIAYLFENKYTDIIFIDPQTWNKRAIRCYAKCGFLPMLIINNREMHDGEYKDSLIMAISFKEWKTNKEY